MKVKGFVIIFIAIFLIAGCNQPSQNNLREQIQRLDAALYSSNVAAFDKQKADSLLKSYDQFIKDFPNDSLASGYLFKSANLALTCGDGNGAITRFDQFIQKYPDHPKCPVCLFFKAFVYENTLKNLDKSKEIYLLFIEKYPKNSGVAHETFSSTCESMSLEKVVLRFVSPVNLNISAFAHKTSSVEEASV